MQSRILSRLYHTELVLVSEYGLLNFQFINSGNCRKGFCGEILLAVCNAFNKDF